jgi:aminobenzoyl-glutamate utilization protein B
VSLSFPANFQAGPGHNWANAIPMATPIAHKGTVAGARVQAMTLLDAIMRPDVIAQAREYFDKVQSKTQKYTPLIRPQDQPAIHLNRAIMDKYRPEMKKYYYDPTKYKTYLEQLGIKYPTVRTAQSTAAK